MWYDAPARRKRKRRTYFQGRTNQDAQGCAVRQQEERMRRKFGVVVVFCLVAVLFPSVLDAQLTTTAIYGRVTDANGGMIPAAQVAVLNTDTNLSRAAQTHADGEYRIEFLPVGNYRVEIAAQAFRRFVRAGIVLELNVPARADALMHLGDDSQTVTVAERVPLWKTPSPTNCL